MRVTDLIIKIVTKWSLKHSGSRLEEKLEVMVNKTQHAHKHRKFSQNPLAVIGTQKRNPSNNREPVEFSRSLAGLLLKRDKTNGA